MDSMSDGVLDVQSWKMTFIGGTASVEESLVSQPDEGKFSPPNQGRLPLTMTSVGDRVWITQIKGGRHMVRRLMDVGIVPNTEVTVISRTESGSVIVAFQGCHIGLGADIAHRVIVSTVLEEIT